MQNLKQPDSGLAGDAISVPGTAGGARITNNNINNADNAYNANNANVNNGRKTPKDIKNAIGKYNAKLNEMKRKIHNGTTNLQEFELTKKKDFFSFRKYNEYIVLFIPYFLFFPYLKSRDNLLTYLNPDRF